MHVPYNVKCFSNFRKKKSIFRFRIISMTVLLCVLFTIGYTEHSVFLCYATCVVWVLKAYAWYPYHRLGLFHHPPSALSISSLVVYMSHKESEWCYVLRSCRYTCLQIYSVSGVFESELGSNGMLILSCVSASSEVILLRLQDQFQQNSVLETYTKFCEGTLFSD